MSIRSLLKIWQGSWACVVGLLFLLAACGADEQQTSGEQAEPESTETIITESPPTEADSQSKQEAGSFAELTIEVVATYPHDVEAFTQGLELDSDGTVIESTGLVGSSDLRRVDLQTGEIEQLAKTPSGFFAEGATRVGDEIVQLTWKDKTALYWDAATFELKRQVSYEGEGWGLCYDGQKLIMTDGSAELIFRDPETFAEIGRVAVANQGEPVDALNEIECADGVVWANRWTSDQIVGIDSTTGAVVATVDASSIRFQTNDNNAVLNGIAWDETNDTFLLTGKLWPNIYRVKFVPASDS